MSKEKQIEAIEAIEEALRGSDGCKHLPREICNNTSCSRCEAEILYDAGCRMQSEWISVEERLPDLDGSIRTWGKIRIQPSVRVLCACKQKSGKVFVKEGYCEIWGSNVVWKIPGSIDAVTHWMPLPDAPKGGGE